MKQKVLILILIFALLLSCAFTLFVWNRVHSINTGSPVVEAVPAETTLPAVSAEIATEAPPTEHEHSWKDPDCTAPKTCTLCGETSGSPIDHSWSGGSCTAVPTCTRCGAASSQSAGHKWAEATCVAPKTCTVCSATEGTSMDCSIAQIHHFGPWESSGHDIFRTCILCGILDEAGTLTSESYTLAADVLSRTWEADGCTLKLSRDGTFTGNLEGEVSGTWQLMMIRGSYNFDSEQDIPIGCLTLRYTQDGKAKESSLRVRCFADSGSWENSQANTTLYLSERKLTFRCTGETATSGTQISPETAEAKLLGTWTSLACIRKYGDINRWQEMTVDHTIVFLEDGTFAADLEEKFSGTWQFSQDNYGTLSFDCTAEGGRNVMKLELDPKGTLIFFYYGETERNIAYTFQQMETRTASIRKSKMASATPLPLGTWVSHTIIRDGEEVDMVSSTACTDYKLTFHADGTITGTIPDIGPARTVECKWHLASITQDGDYHMYRFDLQDPDATIEMHLYLESSGLYLQYFTTGGRYTIKFWRA